MKKKIGKLSGTAKVHTSVKQVLGIMNGKKPDHIASEEDGKVYVSKLSVVGGREFWAKNFTTIPMNLESYKQKPDVYEEWLKSRAMDCVLEIIKQLRSTIHEEKTG